MALGPAGRRCFGEHYPHTNWYPYGQPGQGNQSMGEIKALHAAGKANWCRIKGSSENCCSPSPSEAALSKHPEDAFTSSPLRPPPGLLHTLPLRTELEGFANDGTYLPHELWQVGRVTEQNAKEDKSVRDIRTTLYSYQEEGRESLRIYCREIK